ncbi:unnamed protein product [Pneumocystis jirovecii]|uniref:CSN8/PSMD8/EIF3K domain-containing protein n=2 Tax=Pneumocystis jirovecii TaxID=42068 RepID=L0PHG6_PNEJI|nr:uncharacterized protein T551_03043 [Pneumocystis jirovecii RU7]KTW27544.1 hypothetical protein T551_03043 [Pneumocystis jirovecii RU7]CCJ31100.1 unnamed protein product [Pneumocystis jirovecii]
MFKKNEKSRLQQLTEYGLISKGNDNRLKDPRIQEELYEKIKEKYTSLIKKVNQNEETLEETFSSLTVVDSELQPANQEHCLYMFRQLREGLRASQRVDAFARTVYEMSARVGIYMNHVETYFPALQYLMDVMYPEQLQSFANNQLVTCYLLYLVCVLGNLHKLYEALLRWKLDIQDLPFQVARIIIENNYVAWLKLRNSLPWLYQRLIDQSRRMMQERCTRVVGAAYYIVPKQWAEKYVGPVLAITNWAVDDDVVVVRVRR